MYSMYLQYSCLQVDSNILVEIQSTMMLGDTHVPGVRPRKKRCT